MDISRFGPKTLLNPFNFDKIGRDPKMLLLLIPEEKTLWDHLVFVPATFATDIFQNRYRAQPLKSATQSFSKKPGFERFSAKERV